MRNLILIFVATSVLAQETGQDRMKKGFSILQRSGQLAQEGKFPEAHKLMAEACAEIDAAVAGEPSNIALRMQRGNVYSQFPEFLGKAAIAREDLEMAAKDPVYSEQAGKRLAALNGAKQKERFTGVPASASPVIAVASVTLPGATALKSREDLPPLLARLMEQIKSYPGFLGSHVLSSADRKGMILLFTWWKDKQSLAAWVDGAAHKAAIQEVYSKPPSHDLTGGAGSQVAMELLLPLPGSIQFNGGLAPREITK